VAAKGKGKDYYQSTYTHEQLWEMLHEGDDYTVERAGTIWVSAASGMKAAREELDVHVTGLRSQWTGPASDEFDNRMNLVKQYSVESESGMQTVGEIDIPHLATALKDAQTQSESLNPAYLEEYEDWVESTKQVDPASPEAQSKKTQWEQEYQADRDKKHEDLALIVANLGDTYAVAKTEKFGELPPPPPSDMPGNNTYSRPTGGVFSETALDASPSTVSGATGPNGAPTGDINGDGLVDADDLEPVDGDWNYSSYDNLDSGVSGGGGLASGTAVPTAGGAISTAGGTGGMGGATLPGGTGLFGPSQSTSSSGGRSAGSSPARSGANGKPSSSPARSGAGSNSGRTSGSGSRLSSSSRNAISRGSGTNPRGGTRSGYSDDDEEETYNRETWLREDDVDWARNNVPQEELDDDDED
jgi:hypothetical protein